MENSFLLKGDTTTPIIEWLNSNKQKIPYIGEDTQQQELNLLTVVGM